MITHTPRTEIFVNNAGGISICQEDEHSIVIFDYSCSEKIIKEIRVATKLAKELYKNEQ